MSKFHPPTWVPTPLIHQAMKAAIERAQLFSGATAPNPPVGAAALDSAGQILAIEAHERAGEAHAEVKVLEKCRLLGVADRVHTLVVTLEPCNHHGKTPPCTDAILNTEIQCVVYGTPDPNPRVKGQGSRRLKEGGIEVRLIEHELQAECDALIRSFSHWSRTGKPWVIVKTAVNTDGSMIPPPGKKTFTSTRSIHFAHELRKRSDAILTGVGTILADSPLFTVRALEDHGGKKRHLIVMDRNQRTPLSWIENARNRGFEVHLQSDLRSAIDFLGEKGCLEVLIEAGPSLSEAVLSSDLWDEHVTIQKNEIREDDVRHVYRNR